MTPALPAARHPGAYSVALVCLGNICRSPMADVVLTTRVAEAGLDDRVQVHSCGTGDWHVGHPMDARAAETLRSVGLDASRHRAQQFTPSWLLDHDLVLAMDQQNLDDIGGRSEHVGLLRDFDPAEPGGEVPDPYYGGSSGFEEVLAMVERSCAALVTLLVTLLVTTLDDVIPDRCGGDDPAMTQQ